MNKDTVEQYRTWIQNSDYNYFITLGVQPDKVMSLHEVISKGRILEFKMNKFYLKNSWSDYKLENRFHFIGFNEGNGLLSHHHWYFLDHLVIFLFENNL